MNTLPATRPSAKSIRVLGRGVTVEPMTGSDPKAPVGLYQLMIRVGDVRDFYTLERIGSDFGDGFQITKHVGGLGDECPIYHVHLSNDGHTCDCPGGTYRGKCKHVEALVALRKLGKV